MAAITWRSVAAPDATGAAQILQQAGQNINKGLGAVQDITDNQIANITDQNVSSIAQQIMGVNEGVDGLNTLTDIQSSLKGVKAADIGGKKGLDSIFNMVEGRRTELETNATNDFNESLALAKQTGDFKEVESKAQQLVKSVRNGAPLIEAAVSAEANYKADTALGLLAKGEDPTEVLAKTGLNLSHPASQKVFAEAARRTNNIKVGERMLAMPSLIKEAVKAGNITAASEKLYAGLTPQEIAENSQFLQGFTKQMQDAVIASKQLTPYEQNTVNSLNTYVEGEIANARKTLATEGENLKIQIGDRQIVESLEATDKMPLFNAIEKVLGKDAKDNALEWFGGESDLETSMEKVNTLRTKENLSDAAILYALQSYGELSDTWGDNKEGFIQLAKSAEKTIRANRESWISYNNKKVDTENLINKYQYAAGAKIGSYIGSAPRQRNNGEALGIPDLPGFENFASDFRAANVKDVAQVITQNKEPTEVQEPVLKDTDPLNSILTNLGVSVLSSRGSLAIGEAALEITSSLSEKIKDRFNDLSKKDKAMAEKQLKMIEERRKLQEQRRNN